MVVTIFHKPLLERFVKSFCIEANISGSYDTIVVVFPVSSTRLKEVSFLCDRNYSKRVVIFESIVKNLSIRYDNWIRAFHPTDEVISNYIKSSNKNIHLEVITIDVTNGNEFYLQKEVVKHLKKSGYKRVVLVEEAYCAKTTKYIFNKLGKRNGLKFDVFSIADRDIIDEWWKNENGLLAFSYCFFSYLHVLISSIFAGL